MAIYGHNIAIVYRRTSTVVYVHNITCATIHNKIIFDWKHGGGQAAPRKNTHTQPKIYGHDTAQSHTQEPQKPHDTELTPDFLKRLKCCVFGSMLL